MGGGAFKQIVLGVAATFAGGFFGAGWLINAGKALFWGGVLGGVSRAMAKKPSATAGATMAATGRLETVRQALSPRQVVYGRCRVGGTLTFFETTTDNQTALMITTLTGHPVNAIRDVYYNDRSALDYGSHGSGSAATGKYAGFSTVYRSNGSEGASQPFADLVARGLSWASTDLQRDCAKVHTTHTFSNEVWQTGLPQVSCVIDGVAAIIDTRFGSPTVSRWTNNPALCIAHYLTATYGLGADYTSEIDQATLIASANICDERVTLSGDRQATVASVDTTNDWLVLTAGQAHFDYGDGLRFSTGSPTTLPGGISEGVTYYAIPVWEGDTTIGQTVRLATSHANAIAGSYMDISSAGSGTITATHYDEPRYRLNGAFSLTEKPQAVIERMLQSMAGRLVNSGGVWYIYAGAYTAPTLTFDEDDFAGPIDIQTNLSRSESANAVKGTFVDPSSRYQPVDFPPVVSQTYFQEDGGQRVYRDIDLTSFVTSSTQAQRLAKIDLVASRLGLSFHARFKLSAFRMMTGATIAVTNTQLGWSAKAFEVINCTLVIERDGRLEVDATLRETDSGVYDWSVSDEQLADLAPNTNLPDPTTVTAPTALAAAQSASVWDTVVLSCTAPSDSFVNKYQFEYRLVEPGSPQTGEWTVLPRVDDPYIEVTRLLPREYQFRVKAVNTFGAASDYATLIEFALIPPATNFNGGLTGSGLLRSIGSTDSVQKASAVCFVPTTNELWVGGDNDIYIHNPATGIFVESIAHTVGSPSLQLSGMVYCPSNGYVYCNYEFPGNKVDVFDPYTRSLIATISITSNSGYGGLYCPSNNSIYIGSLLKIAVINAATNTLTTEISVVPGDADGCFCPVNGYIYWGVSGSNQVRVINPATNTTVTNITVNGALHCVFCPVDGYVYASAISSNPVITVIDPLTNTVVRTISVVDGSPTYTASGTRGKFCPESGLMYFIEQYRDELLAIRPDTGTIIGRINPGTNLWALEWSPSTKTMFCANRKTLGQFSRFSV